MKDLDWIMYEITSYLFRYKDDISDGGISFSDSMEFSQQ